MKESTNNFIGYEYKELTTKRALESIYADGYSNFGWEVEDRTTSLQGTQMITMRFKRDRKIIRSEEHTSELQ